MELWQDQGIVLAVRPHGESGAVVSLFTENNGRHAGYVRGVHAAKMRGVLERGNIVDARWQARVSESLGTFALELLRSYTANFMQDPVRLAALQAACALCDAALPEREGHSGLFHGLLALLDVLDGEVWGPAYVMWEIALLKELGFQLDLSRCAGGGDPAALAYVSPKTGRAVSLEAGEPYKDKLLPLPGFLRPGGSIDEGEDVLEGLRLTGYFLEHWVFAHHTRGVPAARSVFYDRAQKKLGVAGLAR